MSNGAVHFGFSAMSLLSNAVALVASVWQFLVIFLALIVGVALIQLSQDAAKSKKKKKGVGARGSVAIEAGEKRKGRARGASPTSVNTSKYEYSTRNGIRWRASGKYGTPSRKIEWYSNWNRDWLPKEDFFRVPSRRKR